MDIAMATTTAIAVTLVVALAIVVSIRLVPVWANAVQLNLPWKVL